MLGAPSRSGLIVTSYLSESSHDGPLLICRGWMPLANWIRVRNGVAVVVKTFEPPLPTPREKPWSGLLGLMVATSIPGSASAAIGFGGGGGSGIAHTVSGVARARIRGSGKPWDQVPVMEFPSALS